MIRFFLSDKPPDYRIAQASHYHPVVSSVKDLVLATAKKQQNGSSTGLILNPRKMLEDPILLFLEPLYLHIKCKEWAPEDPFFLVSTTVTQATHYYGALSASPGLDHG